MHGCHGCQELMLEHLYDLLDEADQQGFLAHLAGCPACQAALEKVRAQQLLLAEAARMQFPAVQFAPPTSQQPEVEPEPAASPAPRPAQPTLLPVRPRLRRPVAWKRWAVAAGLLLALAGLCVPAHRAHRDYTAAEQVLHDRASAVADARKQLDEAKTELARAVADRDRQIEQVNHDIKAREVRLVVSGPRTVQPGAPTDYLVKVTDLNGQPAQADIHARIAGDAAPAIRKLHEPLAAKGAAPEAARDKGKLEKKDANERAKLEEGTHELKVTSLAAGVYRVSIPPTLRLEPGQARNMVFTARRKGGPADKNHEAGKEQVTLQGKVQLTAPVYLTHLTTDKPMYQPGEVVRFRSLTLDRLTLQPPAEDFHLHYTLTSPLGAVRSILRGRSALVRQSVNGQSVEVKGPDGKAIKGVGAGEVALEPGMPGGEYSLTVAEDAGRFPPVQRKFIVNHYQKPRLDKKLDFNRSSYGPGDEVQARVTALRADGGPVANRPVEIAVNIDDQLLDAAGKPSGRPFAGRTNKDGQVLVRFRLPKNIERGQASLSVKFNDGVVETIVRPIPVVLKKLQVEFFPEGGDLVAGLVNRVYFQARTPLGKPAQLTGTLFDGETKQPVAISTIHDDKEPGVNQGLGVFAFTPKAGHAYSLRIDTPTGVVERKKLPAVRDAGVVMSIPKGVLDPNEPIRVRVQNRKAQTLMVGAYCRGRLLDTVQLEKGQTEAVLRPSSGAGGVCRVTVFEELPTSRGQFALKPVAERLVYRHPQERLDVSIAPDKRRYVPGQKVNLSLVTTDEKEKPKAAILMVAVADRSVLTMADEKTARAMPTHFLLTTEVRRAEDLEYADFLIGQHPKAPQVLDLLLGTQGWRRFAEQNPDQFREQMRKEAEGMPDSDRQRQEEEAERLLVMIGQSTPRTMDPDQEKLKEVRKDFEKKSDLLAAEHRKAAEAVERAGDDPEYRAALVTLGRYQKMLRRGRDVAVPVLTVLLALLLLAGLVTAVREHSRRVWGCVGMAAVCGLLLAAVVRGPFGLPVYQPLKDDRQVAQLAMPPADALERLAEEGEHDLGEKQKADAPQLPGMGGGSGEPGRVADGSPTAVTATITPPAAPGRAGVQKKRAARGKEHAALDAAPFRLAAANKPQINGLADRRGTAPLLRQPRFANAAKAAEGGKGGFQFDREMPFGGPAGRRMFEQAPRARLRDGKDLPFQPPLVVREYAHRRPTNTNPGLRTDFTETLCWHPVLVLPDGKGNVSFDLCDSVTSFQATVFAHTLDGRLGAAVKLIESRLPFTLSPKVPTEVTSSDRIDVAVSVANNTGEKRSVQLALTAAEGLELMQGQREQRFDVAGDARVRKLFRLRPTLTTGTAKLAFEGTTAPFASDGIRESIRVVPDGFPTTGASSDLLETSATHKIKLPGQWIPGTLECRVDVYPSTLADLQKGLEGLLREPHGCFEQSSTSNYPNVLILNYLRTADKANPELERRVREVLARGYQRLTSFECQDSVAKARSGYEWFGGTAPPHEALTAYGLLQFRDMASVYDVDGAMLKRTQDYLMKQRDGKGGFVRNPRAIDTFGRAPQQVTNAYIVWALTESGRSPFSERGTREPDDVAKELNALAEEAKKSDDPYFLSLVAISLANRDRKGEAKELLHKVAKVQKADGHLEARQTSITGSGGRDLQIETTALAVLGWLKTDAQAFDKAIRDSVKWIGQQRGGYGGFGSTQSTILALKALIAYTRANKRTPEAGEVRLYIGEKKVAELAFPAGVDRPLTLMVPHPEMNLKPGANTLRVEITGKKNIFPHTLSWSCRTLKPDSITGCPLDLTATLAKTELHEGDAVRLRVKVKNVSGAGQGMAVAIVGLPAGLIVPEDLKQLKEYCRTPADGQRPLLGAFEINGRELVLYWRDMAKGQEIIVPIDLVARVPGVYRGPASRAYLYYNADKKHWIEPLAVTVAAKAE